jgi:hypothetical protein
MMSIWFYFAFSEANPTPRGRFAAGEFYLMIFGIAFMALNGFILYPIFKRLKQRRAKSRYSKYTVQLDQSVISTKLKKTLE